MSWGSEPFRAGALAAVVIAATAPAVASAALCDGISATSAAPLTTVRVASGIPRPDFVTAPPGDVARIFVLEQDGRIRIVKDGVLLPTPFLDISALVQSPQDPGGGEEEGLLGLAFAPDYEQSHRFFVFHTDSTGANNLIVRYTASTADPDLADPASRQVVLTIPHPYSRGHNGGMIEFGPDDGYLYISSGDASTGCTELRTAPNLDSLLGKMLRIDVRGPSYTVPSDNPFLGVVGARPELWSYGFRNPWRWSFDRSTSDWYAGDVGYNIREEIDYTPGTDPGGGNFGWDVYEGSVCPNPSCGSQGSCALPDYVAPVLDYTRPAGECAVTGGYVYRGCRMPALAGTYFYADFCAAWIHSFKIVDGAVSEPMDRTQELQPVAAYDIRFISSFGEDARGEIYLTDLYGGEVFKIVPVLPSLEASGQNAAPFTLAANSWSWENLGMTSSHPIVSYQVYRQIDGVGSFQCIHQDTATQWGGDPDVPTNGSWFSYVVTARNSAGVQTSPGTGTGGLPRVLSATLCP